MNFYKHWPVWKSLLGIQPDVKRLAELEAQALAGEVLQRELQLIDDKSRVDARRAKIAFINEWLGRPQ